MRVIIIQENGRHDANREYRECFCLQRAFNHHKIKADVWGLGHTNFNIIPDWESYDLILNIENYDETGWVPNLKSIQTKKFLWSIDAHVKGLQPYLQTAIDGNYDLILQSTPQFISSGSVWFPNCYDDELIKPLNNKKEHNIGFCGNINNRGWLINELQRYFDFKLDEFVIGDAMVKAINSYKVHFNANIGVDINYRNFETIGCGTCLLTSINLHLKHLGFVDGYNCLIYSSVEEMIEKAKYVLENPEQLKTISENGLLLARQHTYKERINVIKNLFNGL